MKLRIEADGEIYFLDVENGSFRFQEGASGTASIVEAMPGVFSVLVGDRSFRVDVAPGTAADFEVWPNTRQSQAISLADARDRSSRQTKNSANGPLEVRAQMPGKVVKVLVTPGTAVEAGQGLVVVEAMKMQNEMKAPKDGKVTRVPAKEGTTVAAGEVLVIVE